MQTRNLTKSFESMHLIPTKTRNLTRSKIAVVSKLELTTKIHIMMSMKRNREEGKIKVEKEGRNTFSTKKKQEQSYGSK